MGRIKRDVCHSGLLALLDDERPERAFPEWSMGFYNLNSKLTIEMLGYNDFLNSPFAIERVLPSTFVVISYSIY